MNKLKDISERFRLWYKEPIETLIAKDEHTGFAVLTLTLPILERFVRHKVGIVGHKLPSDSKFYDELVRLFPDFKNRDNAIEFWKLYRHGLLHQATLNGNLTFLKDDGPLVGCWNATFSVSANKLAKRVLSIVGNDLATFEGSIAYGPKLPTVVETARRSGV
jgi:hypothetical protein